MCSIIYVKDCSRILKPIKKWTKSDQDKKWTQQSGQIYKVNKSEIKKCIKFVCSTFWNTVPINTCLRITVMTTIILPGHDWHCTRGEIDIDYEHARGLSLIRDEPLGDERIRVEFIDLSWHVPWRLQNIENWRPIDQEFVKRVVVVVDDALVTCHAQLNMLDPSTLWFRVSHAPHVFIV